MNALKTIAGLFRAIAALLLAAAFFALFAPTWRAGAAQLDAGEASALISESVRRLDLQTEIGERSQGWWANFRLRIPREVASFIFYGSLFVIFAVVIFCLRDNLWSLSRTRRLTRGGDCGEGAAVSAASRMEMAQVEADDLARQGNFAEAMHVLLLRSVGEMRGRLPSSISASMTSREILRRVELSSEGRAVFADIVSRVEVSYFGTHLPGAVEYTSCRESFDTLTGFLRRELIQ